VNASSVRPHTKFAAALVAAGVVSAASLVAVPENHGLPVLNIDVAKASVITDALWGLGNAVNAVAVGAAIASDASSSLPFDVSTAIALAAQNPSIGPNLLSWLIQRYTNPSENYLPYTYPWDIKVSTIEPLAELLPVGSDLIINAVNQISDAINSALSVLPSSDPGVLATDEFWASDIGRTVSAANFALTTPGWVAYDFVWYLGYLPANLEGTLESAIQDPSQLPGLVSNLVWGLLDPNFPDPGLLGYLLDDASRPFTTLPGPIGQLATNIVNAITDGVNGLLAQLPTPITPTPFPSAFKSADPADVPEASLEVGAMTLMSADPVETVEKKVEAPDSTDNTPPVAPQDPAPAADDVDPAAPPAADTDVPEVKPDKPGAHSVKSGNKVSPGDKFDNQPKDETVKDETAKDETVKDTGTGNDTTATPPGAVDSTPGGTDPTGTPAGPNAGAENSDSSDASGAAA
jgi:hypothetical protein